MKVLRPCVLVLLALGLGACARKPAVPREPSSTPSEQAEILSFNWKADRVETGRPVLVMELIKGLPTDKIDAAYATTEWMKTKVFLFHGAQVSKVDWSTKKVEEGWPQAITKAFPGVYSQGVDAVFMHPYQVRFDVSAGRVDPDYPVTIRSRWRGVFDRGIDDALVVKKGTVYFFKGGRYIRYDFEKDRVEDGYPRPINDETWNGIWPKDLDAAFYDDSGDGTAWFIKHRGLHKARTYPDENVIFITWDGIRYQEFFSGKSDPRIWEGPEARLLPLFWSKHSKQGVVFGDDFQGQRMRIANTSGISYPAYVTMLNGLFNHHCASNQHTPECPTNWVETFPERLVMEHGVAKKDVAVFSSWDRISDAVESVKGRLTVNAGLYPFQDPYFPGAHDSINLEQVRQFGENPGNKEERPDTMTWKHAMTYLDNHKPKFMYIYLCDSDTVAHQGRYDRYIHFINLYDQWLDELITKLKAMGRYGERSTIVVTTDHGRGLLGEWRNHGRLARGEDTESVRKVWSFVIGPHTPKRGTVHHAPYSHVHLRPTMEKLLGLSPFLGDSYVLKEAFQD